MLAFTKLLLLVSLSASYTVVRASVLKNCKEDEDCPAGTFCFPDTKVCTRCFSCRNYMRRDPDEDICVKEPIVDCGDCADGYEEERLTTGQVRELCTAAMIQPPLANTTAQSALSSSLQWIVVFGVLAVLLVLVFATVIWLWKPSIKARARAEMLTEPTDASYCNYAPSAPPPSYETVATEECTSGTNIAYVEKETQNLLQAIPYHPPQWVSNSPDAEDAADEEAGVDAVDGPEQMDSQSNVPDIHDEETMQSTWTPGWGYGNQQQDTDPGNQQQDTGITQGITQDFAGLFTSPTSPPSPSYPASGDSHTSANHSASEEDSNQRTTSVVINAVINLGNSSSCIVSHFGNS